MDDKRRRVRVQGGWAGPAKSQAPGQPAFRAKSHPHQGLGQTWMKKELPLPEKQFVYEEPKEEVVRRIPEPQMIDKEGVYEISLSPTGISRIRLFPNFIESEEADWIFEQLCQDIPWKQRTGIREDTSYLQPRLTAWYGELPYTYSRITMEPNPQGHCFQRKPSRKRPENLCEEPVPSRSIRDPGHGTELSLISPWKCLFLFCPLPFAVPSLRHLLSPWPLWTCSLPLLDQKLLVDRQQIFLLISSPAAPGLSWVPRVEEVLRTFRWTEFLLIICFYVIFQLPK